MSDDTDERVGASPTVKIGVGLAAALGAAAIGSFVLFRMMNRVEVEGLEKIPAGNENVLYCLNHNSLIDNFAFESVAYLPKALFEPEYLPISLADRKNFFGDPRSRRFKDRVLRLLGKHFFSHLRAYPVDRRRGDLDQVEEWAALLERNIVIVFPEGTRSRTGEIGSGRAGVGKLIHLARPTVIPVRIWGMEKVLGVGRVVPRVFQTIHIRVGDPLDLSDLLARPVPEERKAEMDYYREISNRVVDAIRALEPVEP
jgi:1-acyl-sn-glycerol-3-phosphate acyltransferase